MNSKTVPIDTSCVLNGVIAYKTTGNGKETDTGNNKNADIGWNLKVHKTSAHILL